MEVSVLGTASKAPVRLPSISIVFEHSGMEPCLKPRQRLKTRTFRGRFGFAVARVGEAPVTRATWSGGTPAVAVRPAPRAKTSRPNAAAADVLRAIDMQHPPVPHRGRPDVDIDIDIDAPGAAYSKAFCTSAASFPALRI
jgi:hypothetical protein